MRLFYINSRIAELRKQWWRYTFDDDDDGGGLKVGEVFRRPSSLFNSLFMSFLKHSPPSTHNGDDQRDEDDANDDWDMIPMVVMIMEKENYINKDRNDDYHGRWKH